MRGAMNKVLPAHPRAWNRLSMSTAVAERVTEKIYSPGFSIKGEATEGRPAYLDFQATTPMDPRVLDKMMPYLTERYGNPHSRTHSYGWETETAIEEAREHVARLIGASSKVPPLLPPVLPVLCPVTP